VDDQLAIYLTETLPLGIHKTLIGPIPLYNSAPGKLGKEYLLSRASARGIIAYAVGA